MNIFSYKLEHDFGLAPNPFGGTLTLAVCKGQIRNNPNLQLGDWIIGTGSVTLNCENKLIYAMRVDEIMTFDEYWNNPLYEYKRPIMNGTLVQMYGDNFYHTDNTGMVIQEPSAHSLEDGTPNDDHLNKDVDGRRVLLTKHFYYFGDHYITIPEELNSVCCGARNYQYEKIPQEIRLKFIEWLESNYNCGIYGDPISWEEFKLPTINYFEDE